MSNYNYKEHLLEKNLLQKADLNEKSQIINLKKKMDKKNIKFDGTEIEEYRFCQYKSPIPINKVDFD